MNKVSLFTTIQKGDGYKLRLFLYCFIIIQTVFIGLVFLGITVLAFIKFVQ